MSFILFEDASHLDLLPLTWTRPLYDIRCGIFTQREKWERALAHTPGTCAWGHLADFFPASHTTAGDIWINGKFYPDAELIRQIRELTEPGTFLENERGEIVSFRFNHNEPKGYHGIHSPDDLDKLKNRLKPFSIHTEKFPAIRSLTDIYRLNREFITRDFALLKEKSSGRITDPHTVVYGADNLWIGEGVKTRAAVINAEDGPVYIGNHVDLQEGSLLHNAHALCDHVTISMGAKLRGDSTFGPWSKMGGEIGNSVVLGFSNKAHDGYMGNSVIGEWCNIGADSNTSNLKNNYAPVRLWNYHAERFTDTGTMFCGLIFGDHSKCGINTMFNTGTVVGVACNIFGEGYPRNFIPDFSWGGKEGVTTYKPEKVFEVEAIVMGRRNRSLDERHKALLTKVFELTAKWRKS